MRYRGAVGVEAVKITAVSSLLADPTAEAPGAPAAPASPEAVPASVPACPHCGAAMAPAQDWCLECGAAAPGRLAVSSGLRMAALVAVLTVLIASGIVAAAYAALSSDSRRTVSRAVTVTAPAPVASVPTTPTPAPVTPTVPAVPKVTAPPATAKPATPPVAPVKPVTPPVAVTPHVSAPTHTTTTPVAKPKPTLQPLLLDTDAATLYDPANHPASTFGDPSNAIDQDPATAWTANLDPGGKLGAGIDIDLKSLHRVSKVVLVTDTPGMAVTVYGSAAATPPATITDPAWTQLAAKASVKHDQTLKLATGGRRLRQILAFVVHGPGSGSAGQVDIAELSVYPSKRS